MKLIKIFILSIIITAISACAPTKPAVKETPSAAKQEVQPENKVSVGNQISQYSHDHNITEVEVQGMGADRDKAIADAQRNAISTAIGTYLISEQEVQNYMTVKDQILSKSEGFVKSYSVVDQYKESDGSFVVKIKAAVTKDILLNDLEALGILLAQIGNPSIVVFYQPKGVPYDKRYTEQAINQINQYFTINRYNVYELDQLNAMIEDDMSMKQVALNQDADMAELLAKKLKADIYVTVGIMLEDLGNGKKKAKSTAKIFNASTAKLLGVQNGYSDEIWGNNTAYDANIDQSIKKLMPLIMNQVKGYWKEQLDKGKMYVLMFSGLPQGREFKQVLNDIVGSKAKEMKKISYEEYNVWITVTFDEYINSIGTQLEENVYGGEFDYKNRGDRIDIFPVKK
ncbi:MAG TPA: hypothetical protein PLK90_05395 [Clostridiales bacterium]|nr:hypothetical protein [Clostridiales bacterium]HQP69816.1 hypothetical protein [Clostridiales bacterium]